MNSTNVKDLSPRSVPVVLRQERPAYLQLVWVAAGGVLGFVIAAVFAGALNLPRTVYLIPYLSLVGLFLAAYVDWSGFDLAAAIRHHVRGSVAAAALGVVIVVANVWSQRASPPPQGFNLLGNLLWLGLAYGLADALLLSVLPVVAVWRFCSTRGWTQRLAGRLVAGGLGWVASILVSMAYHLGYPEFRGPQVLSPMVGNGLITLVYMFTMNPLVAVVVHVAMHMAAVLHGINTAIQLPPH